MRRPTAINERWTDLHGIAKSSASSSVARHLRDALTAATPNSNLVKSFLAQPLSTAPREFTWSSNSEQIHPARRRLRFGAGGGFGRFRQNPGFLLGRQPG